MLEAEKHPLQTQSSQLDGTPSARSLRQRTNAPLATAGTTSTTTAAAAGAGMGNGTGIVAANSPSGSKNENYQHHHHLVNVSIHHCSDTDSNSSSLTVPSQGSTDCDSQNKNDPSRRSRLQWLAPSLLRKFRGRKLPVVCLCVVPVLCALVILLHLRPTLRRSYRRFFGVHPIEGGSIGHWLDGIFIQHAIDSAFKKQQNFLSERGVFFPDLYPVSKDMTLGIDTHAALREVLVRREMRTKLMLDLDNASRVWSDGCRQNRSKRIAQVSGSKLKSDDSYEENFGMIAGIPKVLHVPDLPGWISPRPGVSRHFQTLTFSDVEMRRFIKDNHASLLKAYMDTKDENDRILLWSIVVLYHYGGVVVGNGADADPTAINAFSRATLSVGNYSQVAENECAAPLAIVALESTLEQGIEERRPTRISMIATTPYHPRWRCILDEIESEERNLASKLLDRLFTEEAWAAAEHRALAENPPKSNLFPWQITPTRCSTDKTKQKCCSDNIASSASLAEILRQKPNGGQVFGRLKRVAPRKPSGPLSRRTSIVIKEKGHPKKPLVGTKTSLEKTLKMLGGEPSWICSRCLKSPMFGSLEKCSQVCPKMYEDVLCQKDENPSTTNIDVAVSIRQEDPTANRIPRIVHQTWFEPITPDLYPQLSRLQNSWKQSGWEYRFYTDTDAREYIIANYPPHFLEAFDAVIPGAYKADLFRYLVLLKDGGIYADIDIKLDTTLDSFITPNLSFFAPRDAVAEYAGEPFCLWNGMVGSAAGHPFMMRAVERLVNLIIQRSDLYDLERSVCQSDGVKTENWKVRIEPQLFLSGPCALGIAVNEALNRTSLSKLDIGWLPEISGKVDHGDALILVGDKYDLGSFRISDPERNIMVAATDLPGINKESRTPTFLTAGDKLRLRTRRGDLPHYSTTTFGKIIWGQEAVYKDDVVLDKRVRLRAASSS